MGPCARNTFEAPPTLFFIQTNSSNDCADTNVKVSIHFSYTNTSVFIIIEKSKAQETINLQSERKIKSTLLIW